MKKLIMIMLVAAMAAACNQTTPKTDVAEVNTIVDENLKLQVIYFHATNRCVTCNSIETNVKTVLENNFKNELENGIIQFRVLNVDEAANKSLAEKYMAFGASLHLVEMEDGKEINNDLTQLAFMNTMKNPQAFQQQMTDTIQKILYH